MILAFYSDLQKLEITQSANTIIIKLLLDLSLESKKLSLFLTLSLTVFDWNIKCSVTLSEQNNKET